MPPESHTPLRSFRIPNELWQAARETAKRRNESLADVVRASLERYVRRHRER